MSAATASVDPALPPRLSITVLAFNRRDEVRTTLRKLTEELDYPAGAVEIIVADNASSDGTSEMVAREFPRVKCLALATNGGIAGLNRAFESATGDYFLVLDDDSSPVTGIREAIEYIEANPRIGIIACSVVGGAYPTSGFDLQDRGPWVGFIGCGVIIRRALYERIGGFAEWMFIYANEWEYGLRCLDAGYEIRFFKAAVVEHRAATTNRSSRRLITYTVRNELLMIYKHFATRRLLYSARVVAFNILYFRPVGPRALLYIADGFGKFILAARHLRRTPVKADVQERFASQLLATQPVLPRLTRTLRRIAGFAAIALASSGAMIR